MLTSNGRAPFTGFPAGNLKATAIPNLFFCDVLPGIESLPELKLTLDVFWRTQEKKRYPRYVTLDEVVADCRRFGLLGAGADVTEDLTRKTLDKAVERGVLLHLTLRYGERERAIYLMNTAQGRKAVEALRNGELDLGQDMVERPVAEPPPARPDIYSLYEQNVGLLTPLIAEQLQDAERLYPTEWIEEAIRIAVEYNKRNWRYIQAILERWAFEGKTEKRR